MNESPTRGCATRTTERRAGAPAPGRFLLVTRRESSLRVGLSFMLGLAPVFLLLAIGVTGAWWFASRGVLWGAVPCALLAGVAVFELALAVAASRCRSARLR